MNPPQQLLRGVGVALVTPFQENLAIDYAGFAKLLSHTTDIGVDYWVVQGTTGESATTSAKEKTQLLDFAKTNNPKNLPIVYGIGGNCTEEVVKTIKNTDFERVTAILSVSPYYSKPSQKGIVAHYTKIADASPVPIILYNVPGRTASNLTAQTTLALARHTNIIGIKEASGNLVQCMEIARNKPHDFMLISGDDMLTTSMISFGAEGVISVMANACRAFNEMTHKALEGQYKAASQKLFELLPLNDLMYAEGNPVGIKVVLALQGICSDFVRMPLEKASDSLKTQIQSIVELIRGLEE